ncbi:MAG: ABC transporter ATP-binding protein [Planctomycetes bacterium]|nr:ABC transporter ATP-binding protein [Planctomycetota bacterium]
MSQQTANIIEMKDVYKSFGTLHVLRGISLEVKKGETLVIIGQSGTGKSVTLRLMIGLLVQDSGDVFFEGNSVKDMDEFALVSMRKRMSMLFQGGALFDSLTVGENVAFGLRAQGEKDEAKIRSIVTERLGQVGLPGTEDKMPSELSGGMKKRAALARSIAEMPELILYDEPTTGLDPIMSDAIADLILETRAALKDMNVTSIVVTHDMHVATKTADRIVMLHGGNVVGEGPPEYFEEIRERDKNNLKSKQEEMIRQFVRGEAVGPIMPQTS